MLSSFTRASSGSVRIFSLAGCVFLATLLDVVALRKTVSAEVARADPASLDATEPQITTGFETLGSSVIRIQTIVNNVDWFEPYKQPQAETFVGSGFAVQMDEKTEVFDPVFLTNAHVVSDASMVQVQLPMFGQEVFDAYVPLICHHFDLAVIRLADPAAFSDALAKHQISLEPVQITNMSVSLGLEVAAVGFPLGTSSLKLSRGIISGTELVKNGFCYQSTAPISPGSSGGPLFALDRNGVKRGVVGVNFATSAGGNAQNANYVVPTLHIRQLLTELVTQEAKWKLEASSAKPAAGAQPTKHRHAQMLVAPMLAVEVEASESLYKASNGCTTGVFLSRILPKSVLATADPPMQPQSFVTRVADIELDSYGMGSVPGFPGERSSFNQLLVMLKNSIDENITVTSCSNGVLTRHALSMRQRPEHLMGVREVTEPHFEEEALDYETFAGITVMQMSLNHVQFFASQGPSPVGRWLLPENQIQPQVIVSHVDPGTYASRVLTQGMVVSKLNGQNISSLKDFRTHFDSTGSTWELETDRGVVYSVEFEKMLTDQLVAASNPMGRHLLRPAVLAAASSRKMIEVKSMMIQTSNSTHSRAESKEMRRRAVVPLSAP